LAEFDTEKRDRDELQRLADKVTLTHDLLLELIMASAAELAALRSLTHCALRELDEKGLFDCNGLREEALMSLPETGDAAFDAAVRGRLGKGVDIVSTLVAGVSRH
jgi:hypothetical protein